MILFLSPTEAEESALPSVVEQAKQNRLVVDFITSMRATVVSLGIYPPGSATIANAVEKVAEQLRKVLEAQPTTTLSEVSGRLMVDDRQLDSRDQKKAPVVDFLTSMIERKIQSITFKTNTSTKELIDFLVILSRKPEDLKQFGPVPEQLTSKGIKNIQLNERIYVATSVEEQEEAKKREGMLKRMLAAEAIDLNRKDIDDLLSDKDAFQAALKALAGADRKEEIGEDPVERATYIQGRTRQVKEMVQRTSAIVQSIQDEQQRSTFREGLAEMMADLDPEILVKDFLEEQQNPTAIGQLDLQPMIFQKLGAEKSIRLTGEIIGQIEKTRSLVGQVPAEQLKSRLEALKKMLGNVMQGAQGKEHLPQIAELLMKAGLVKGEALEKMKAQAAQAAQAAQTEAAPAAETASAAKPVQIQFVESDGSVDDEILFKVMRNFTRIPKPQVPGVVEGLSDIIAEVVFHEHVGDLVDGMIQRMVEEKEYSTIYTACAEFLEKLCKELIFNEKYDAAKKIVGLFHEHADPKIDRHYDQKKHAFRVIDSIASEEVTRMLLTVYQHGEEEARQEVGALIVKLGQRMLTALLELLKSSEDRSMRRHIINLLKQMGQPVIEAIRLELTNAENAWYVVRNLVIMMSEMGGTEHAEWLQPLLSHGEPRVRREAVKALAQLDPQGSVEFIRMALQDSDISVRGYTISTLGALRDTPSIPQIAELIGKRTKMQVEEEEQLQLDAITAMAKMNDPSVVPYLLTALKKEGLFSGTRTKSPQIRARACFALAPYPSEEVAKAIKAATKDGNPIVAEAAKSVMPRMARYL
ncbi:MAG: hypothetical protein C4523_00480 [Myxococcales bacterium]|nr:MAG: hypothetical protein C4523_00480 [Myxococcales bacterium]